MALITLSIDMSEPREIFRYIEAETASWSFEAREALRTDLIEVADSRDGFDLVKEPGGMVALIGPRFLDVLRKHGLGGLEVAAFR